MIETFAAFPRSMNKNFEVLDDLLLSDEISEQEGAKSVVKLGFVLQPFRRRGILSLRHLERNLVRTRVNSNSRRRANSKYNSQLP